MYMCILTNKIARWRNKPFIFFSLLLASFIVYRSNHRHMYVVNVCDSILRAESSVHMLHEYGDKNMTISKLLRTVDVTFLF